MRVNVARPRREKKQSSIGAHLPQPFANMLCDPAVTPITAFQGVAERVNALNATGKHAY